MRKRQSATSGGGRGRRFVFPPLLATDGRIHKGDCDMRMGAIFARGSCRALKWMALVGVVLVLGSGLAAAQVQRPSSVTLSQTGAGELTVTWTPPTGGDTVGAYQYIVKTGAVPTTTEWAAVSTTNLPTPPDTDQTTGQVAANVTKLVITGVDTAGDYRAYVRTASTDATVVYSLHRPSPSLVTVFAAPGAVTINSADTTAGDGMMTLAWNAVTGNSITYQYRVKEGDTDFAANDDSWTGVGSATKVEVRRLKDGTALKNGSTYSYEVRAVAGGVAPGTASTRATLKPVGKPGMPTSLTLDRDTDGETITLQWSAPSSNGGATITRYDYRRHDGSGTWTAWASNGTNTSVVIGNLVADREYTFEVAAVNSSGRGPAATVTTDPRPGSPTTLTNATLVIDAPNPDEGSMVNVTGTLSAEVPANTSTWTSVKAIVNADELTDPAALGRLPVDPRKVAVTPAEDGDFTVTDDDTSNLDPKASTLTFVFPPNGTNSSRRHTITDMFELQTRTHDADAEDEGLRLSVGSGAVTAASWASNPPATHTNMGKSVAYVTVTVAPKDIKIEDDEDQAYELVVKGGTEGKSTTLTVKADPEHVQGSRIMSLSAEADPSPANDYSITSSVTVGPAGNNEPTATLTAPANDGNRVDDTVTVTMASGTASSRYLWAEEEVKIADIHKLPAVTAIAIDANGTKSSPQPTELEEGERREYRLEIAKALTLEDIRVTLKPGGDADAQDLGDIMLLQSIAIDRGETRSGKFSLEAVTNDDVGPETLVLTASVTGDATYGDMPSENTAVTLTIVDNTKKQVEPQPEADRNKAVTDAMTAAGGDDDGLNPGEAFSVDGKALIKANTGYTATYTATSSNTAVATVTVSGDVVTVTPEKAGGPATITVTAIANRAVSSATTIESQTVADRATVSFDVTVTDRKLMVTSLTADPPEIDEGGMSTITATLNRAVTSGDGVVTIGLVVVGTATLDKESITIAMGDTSGSAMLTAGEDADYDDETVTVVASGSGIDGTMQVEIMVMETPLAELTVTVAAAEMTIDEGGSTLITATASRMLEEGETTTVNLTVVGDAELSADSITIGAGEDSDSVTLTSTDDSDHETGETLTVVASGADVEGGNVSIEIAVTDNDDEPVVEPTVSAKDGAAEMIAAEIAKASGGADWMVGGMAAPVDMSTLFNVDEGVTAAYSGMSSDNDVVRGVTSGNTLTLTPMGAGTATITVTASDAASNSVATVTHDAMVVLQTLMVGVTASANAVGEGGSVTLTAKANRAVTADTAVTLTVTGDTAAVSVADSITIPAGSDTGTATLMAVEDDDTADANVTVVATGSGIASPISIAIAVTDNDRTVVAKSQAEVDAVFALAIGGNLLPGDDAATVDMSGLFTIGAGARVEYTAESSNEDSVMASASGSTLTLTPGETGESTISVTATDSGGDVDDTAGVSSIVTVGVLPLEITSVTASATDVAEGGTVEITASANKMVDANVEVMLIRDATSTAGEDDYKLEPSAMITIMAGESMGKVTLKVEDDIETEPAESLTLVARVKDLGDVGTVMITIAASDPKSMFTLSGPADMNLVEGQSYELTVTADPAVQEDTEVPIMRDRAGSDADDADFTAAAVMLKAGDASGTTMLMVTDDGMDDSGHGSPEMLVLYIADGGANQRLSFNIWDAAVPALPVIAQLLLAAFLAIGGYRRYLRR